MSYNINNLIENEHFNGFQETVEKLISDVASRTASGVNVAGFGYGKVETFATKFDEQLITASEWVELINNINRIAAHQGTVLEDDISVDDVLTDDNNPAVNDIISAFVSDPKKITDALDQISDNRFNVAVNRVSSSSGGVYGASSRTELWESAVQHESRLVFNSYKDMRYFFNTGGKIKINADFAPGSTGNPTSNAAWESLLPDFPEIVVDFNNTTLSNSEQPVDNIGFYSLSSTFSTIYRLEDADGNSVNVQLRRVDKDIYIRVRYLDISGNPVGTELYVNIDLVYANDEFRPLLPSSIIVTGLDSVDAVVYQPVQVSQQVLSITEDDVDVDMSTVVSVLGGSGDFEFIWSIPSPPSVLPAGYTLTDADKLRALFTPTYNGSYYFAYDVDFNLNVYDTVTRQNYDFTVTLSVTDTTPEMDLSVDDVTIDEGTSYNLGSLVTLTGGSGSYAYSWSYSASFLTIDDSASLNAQLTASNVNSDRAVQMTLTVTDTILNEQVTGYGVVLVKDTTAPFSASLNQDSYDVDENTVLDMAGKLNLTGGIGPFTYEWSVFPDNNSLYSFITASDIEAPQIQVTEAIGDKAFTLIVEVTDTGDGTTVTDTATVNVYDLTPPVTASAGTISVDETQSVDLSTVVSYSGGHGPLDVVYEILTPGYGNLVGSVYTSNYIGGTEPQTVDYQITVTDLAEPGEVATATSTITINNNVPPLEVVFTANNMTEKSAITLGDYLGVTGGSGSYSVSWAYDKNAPVLDSAGNTARFIDVYNVSDSGSTPVIDVDYVDYTFVLPVRVTVTDDNTGEVEQVVSEITVSDQTTPLSVTLGNGNNASPSFTMLHDATYNLSSLISISGGYSPYSYAWTTPADVNVNGTDLTFTGAIDGDSTPQSKTLTLVVTDDEGTVQSSNEIIFDVKYNWPQITGTLNDKSVNDDDTTVMSIDNLAGGSGDYTYAWSFNPSNQGITIDDPAAANPTLTIPDLGVSQTITVDVTVTDTTASRSANFSATVTIENANFSWVNYYSGSGLSTIDNGDYPATIWVEPKTERTQPYQEQDGFAVNHNTFRGGIHEYALLSVTDRGASNTDLVSLVSNRIVPAYEVLQPFNSSATHASEIVIGGSSRSQSVGISAIFRGSSNRDTDTDWKTNRSKFKTIPDISTGSQILELNERPVYYDNAGNTAPAGTAPNQIWTEVVAPNVSSFNWDSGKEYVITVDTSALGNTDILSTQYHFVLDDNIFSSSGMTAYDVRSTDNYVAVIECSPTYRLVLTFDGTVRLCELLDNTGTPLPNIVSVMERSYAPVDYSALLLQSTSVDTWNKVNVEYDLPASVASATNDIEICVWAQCRGTNSHGGTTLENAEFLTFGYFYLPSNYRDLFTNVLTNANATGNKYYMVAPNGYTMSSKGNPHTAPSAGIFIEWDSVADTLAVVVSGTEYYEIRAVSTRTISERS
tara:strand:+ start:55551 stop:59864 length:4314 start_codon:yes stop_codon:yes gene_type:complete